MALRSVGRTDVGRRRAVNEDSYFRDDHMGFYVVADGVGGHNKGEVASRECVDQLEMGVRGAARNLERLTAEISAGDHEAIWEVRRLLAAVVQSA